MLPWAFSMFKITTQQPLKKLDFESKPLIQYLYKPIFLYNSTKSTQNDHLNYLITISHGIILFNIFTHILFLIW